MAVGHIPSLADASGKSAMCRCVPCQDMLIMSEAWQAARLTQTSGRRVGEGLRGIEHHAHSCTDHPFISVSYDHTCKLWDLRQQRCWLSIDHQAPVEAVAFFSSGDYALQVYTAVRWFGMHVDVAPTRPPPPTIAQTRPSPTCAGSMLATASGTDICIWDVAGGRLVQRVAVHKKTATCVLVAQMIGSKPHIVSAGLDGHVKVGCWHSFHGRHAKRT